jgi:LmbE family N-acetylglucosaminyl deacetylase
MQNIIDSFDRIFANKQRIMAVMPHPDDLEIYCGATIARLIKEGKKVRVIKMTYGDKGGKQQQISQKELRNIREKEDRKAMRVLGVNESNNIYLGIGDGEIEHNLETIGRIVYQIRLFKPEIIITTNPEEMSIGYAKDVNWVNHRDHRHCGKIAIDAAYPYARDLLFFPEHFKNKEASSHSCAEFLLTDYYGHPDLVHIDVTDFTEFRTRALSSHSSQYSRGDAQSSTDFFTKSPKYGKKRYERFRYVATD